jgi:CRP-like cAMP-binding protein
VSASVQRFRLLTGVPDADVQRLLAVPRRRRFARGEVVFHRHDPADTLHFITKGRFAVRVMTPCSGMTSEGRAQLDAAYVP